MTTLQTLPHHENEALAAMSAPDLIRLLTRDEDRVPRTVIDECTRRGETFVELLRDVLAQGRGWEIEREDGEWWLLLHAVMILGLMPSESAGLLLTQYMRRMDEEDDDSLQDWFSANWAALFRNKPASTLPAIRALCEDQELDWYIRSEAVETVIAFAHAEGGQSFDAALDWAAGIAADENEDWDLRIVTGNTLLDFAPARHRTLLENLASRQFGLGGVFSEDCVAKAYASERREIQWERFTDPWAFYTPEAIAARQQRRLREDEEDEYQHTPAPYVPAPWDDDAPAVVTFVREGPKIGRNDPCPCGSGKKFKKCCIDADRG